MACVDPGFALLRPAFVPVVRHVVIHLRHPSGLNTQPGDNRRLQAVAFTQRSRGPDGGRSAARDEGSQPTVAAVRSCGKACLSAE